jgi:hypothetical protein
MTRPTSGATDTELAKTLTRPLFLVELGFAPTIRLSSREEVTWDARLWVAASMKVNVNERGGSIEIFNEELLLGNVVLLQGTAGRFARVYQLHGDGPTWATDDAVQHLDGEMGDAEITTRVRITLKARPPQKTPRLLFAPPVFNFLPPDGLVIKTGTETATLEAKPAPWKRVRGGSK